MITADVLCDSISANGTRLTTVIATYPRFIHAELLTHRALSKNAASGRAVPLRKVIEQVETNPVVPLSFGKNQPGMQSDYPIEDQDKALAIWNNAKEACLTAAKQFEALQVHKQFSSRILETFNHITTIISATEWQNFFDLRIHPSAQPEMQKLAKAIRDALAGSTPTHLAPGEWHLPLLTSSERLELQQNKLLTEDMKKRSVARCARVSYLTHDKNNPDPGSDENLHDRLKESRHYSCFEHIATPDPLNTAVSNFSSWLQYRGML